MAKAKKPAETPEPNPAHTSETPKRKRRPYVAPPTLEAPKAEDYELPDSHFDPEIDMAPSLETPKDLEVSDKPRDGTGKFTKKPHPERLVALARELNIGEDEITNSSTSELRATVNEEQLRLLLSQRDDRHRSNIQDALNTPSAPAAEPEPEPAFPELEETNPALAKFLKQQSSELKQLKAFIVQQAQVAEAQTLHQVFDAAFAGLGKEYEKFFGAGSGDSVGKDDVTRRNAIIAAASVSKQTPKPQVISKIQSAARSVYGAVIATPEPEVEAEDFENANGHTPRISAETWAKSGQPYPSGNRRPQMPKGAQRAAHAVADKMREHRITEDDFDSIEEQNLPD